LIGPALVELREAQVVRGSRVTLDVPALSVNEGEVLAVIGPNGAGKSTLLRLLGALERPASGELRFRGAPVRPAEALAVRRRMAVVFQDPLLADRSVFDNVALGLRFRHVPAALIAPRVTRWMERFGIGHLAALPARTLSGGEAQRTALARALVLEPELLLLDEPFSALDQPTRERLLQDLRAILRAEATTTVLVTHHRGEALALGDRVAVLMGGRLLQVGLAGEVFRSPTSEEVARFVGMETMVECRVVDRAGACLVLEAGPHEVRSAGSAALGDRVLLCLRPEDVRVAPGPVRGADGGGANRLPGTVVQLVPAPLHVRVTVDCGFRVVALATHREAAAGALVDGAQVNVEFDASAAHLIPVAAGFGNAGEAP
jgi:tungstate transport system ATP-binding protein